MSPPRRRETKPFSEEKSVYPTDHDDGRLRSGLYMPLQSVNLPKRKEGSYERYKGPLHTKLAESCPGTLVKAIWWGKVGNLWRYPFL